MSEVFEGFLASVAPGHLKNVVDETGVVVPLAFASLEEGTAVCYRVDPRDALVFSEAMDRIVSNVSKSIGRSLLVRYDSRTGHRSATLYDRGEVEGDFGPDDELFVPLDEEGDPVRAAVPLPRAALDPDEEYETHRNAIELGISALGVGTWPALLAFMSRQ